MVVMPVAKSNNITNNNISISLWLNAILSPFCLWLFKNDCKGTKRKLISIFYKANLKLLCGQKGVLRKIRLFNAWFWIIQTLNSRIFKKDNWYYFIAYTCLSVMVARKEGVSTAFFVRSTAPLRKKIFRFQELTAKFSHHLTISCFSTVHPMQ